ncbi:MAG: endonuclease/exonuclease/phosphatase family protein [Desulfobacterales bacterium]|nr:endonuclease/exonuclease/phosphatase family protein [Desulfobacterales bacterium]
MKHLTLLLSVLSLSVFGCVSIPDHLTVVNQPQNLASLAADEWCHPEYVYPPQLSTPARSIGIKASGFRLLSWNIQKENRAGWEKDLVRLSQNADILIIQEAHLTDELKAWLNRKPYYWHLVTAFEYQDTKTGVLTAASSEPDFICPQRAAEPLIRFPKTILITRYPLAHSHHSLMIANVHMINFAPDLSAFRKQVHQMTEVLIDHQGPMIVAGDFNTWSEERLAIIETEAGRLALLPADFKTDAARKVFGYTVDRIYYRGLTLEEALVVEVTSSDHNPLKVAFRLKGDGE